MSDPRIIVNGSERPLAGVPTHTNLLDFVRGLGLTGAKEGCAEGECGACSLMVARPGPGETTQWVALNACLTPALALDGQEVVTAEGLGDPDHLHPVQAELAAEGGSQCGYCTPGFVCSMAAEYYRDDRDGTPGQGGFDEHAIAGNLCRCTGYRPIRDACHRLATPEPGDPLAARRAQSAPAPAATRTDGLARPASLAEALDLLAAHPEATVVAGSTDWGVEANLRGSRASYVVLVDRLPELRGLERADDAIEIGAGLTLTEVEQRLAGSVPLLTAVFPQFASRLIRNAATIGGNLATASPIGDLPPALIALDATVVVAGPDGDRDVPIDEFFTDYRQTALRPGELVRAIRVPLPLAATTAFHKVAKRRLDDISSVAVAFALDVVDGAVARARIGLGGVAATPLRARATEQALLDRPWSEENVRAAAEVLRGEGTPMDDHRASAAYRSAMLGTALPRLWSEVGA